MMQGTYNVKLPQASVVFQKYYLKIRNIHEISTIIRNAPKYI